MKKYISLCLSLALMSYHSDAQEFSNLNFEQLCDTSKTGLCHWDLSWGAKNSCKPDLLLGNTALLIEQKSGVGWTEQELRIEPSDNIRVIKINARLKTNGVIEKGAGLNLGIYDNEGSLLATKDSGNYGGFGWITETTDWKNISVEAVSPPGTASIKIGGILYGPGKAWFDDFEVIMRSADDGITSEVAQEYISHAMDTISKHALRKDSVNLITIKKNALQIAGNAREFSDCHLAIEYMLNSLGDHHSFFMDAEAVRAWEGTDEDFEVDIEMPSSRIESGYGHVLVPPFHGGDSMFISKYSSHLQNELNGLYKQNIKGWIIDLRENTGGNMEPMIAGLGPVFDSKVLGHLVDVNGGTEAWIYDNGKYMWDDVVVFKMTNPFVFANQLPIAVLMSHQTGSSGEIVLISFIGNQNTRTFGQPSWGLTTGNGAFDLIDGSRMHLASTRMADRNGNVFYGSIEPDEFIESSSDKDHDPVLHRAIEWLNGFDYQESKK